MIIKDCALDYASSGWSVLPVRPEEKRPFMSNWLQYNSTKATEEQIKNWFKSLSGAGVGVVTGRISEIVVLDVESACSTPISEILKLYPTGRVAKTGSGGYHLFFKYPVGVTHINNRVRMFENVDLRADGGFIVLPPTLHPSGNLYEWINTDEMGEFPTELLRASQQPTKSSTGDELWISDMLHGVGKGSRDDSAAKLAGYFYKKGVSPDIIESLLAEWNERNNPPLPIQDIRRVVASVGRYYADRPVAVTSVEFIDDRGTVQVEPVVPISSPNQPTNTFNLVRVGDYIKDYGGDGVSWAIKDWLPEKSITFLVSPPESYKTWLLMDLVISTASGQPFLGQFPVIEQGPALIIQQEDNHYGLAERIALIINERYHRQPIIEQGLNGEISIPTIPPELPVYVHPDRQLRFDNPQILQKLENQIASIRPKLVVIDPLYSATSVDNYMASSAEQMMVLKQWRDKYGCSFVIAHHSKKNVDPNSTAREDSWGSQFLNAFLEAGWQIRRNQKLAPNEIVVRRHSKTLGNLPSVSLAFDISTVYPMKYKVQVRDYNAPDDNTSPAKSTLYELIKDEPMTQTQISDKTGKTKSTISRQIKQLVAAGSIQKMPDGKYRAAAPELDDVEE